MENAITAIFVLLFVVLVLLATLYGQVRRVDFWRDAHTGMQRRHDSAMAGFDALKVAHADLQREYTARGRELVIAEGLARAAERINS